MTENKPQHTNPQGNSNSTTGNPAYLAKPTYHHSTSISSIQAPSSYRRTESGAADPSGRSSYSEIGLSTATAKKKLLALTDTDNETIVVASHFDLNAQTLKVLLYTALSIIVLLFVNGIYVVSKGTPRQSRGIGSIIEAILLILSIIITYWVLSRESNLEIYELDRRLRAIASEIRGWNGTYADLRTPQLPTITTYTTLRDNLWRDVPTLLLVEGDIVAVAYGESVPCSVALRSNPTTVTEDFVLIRGQRFTPETMRLWLPNECPPLKGSSSLSKSSCSNKLPSPLTSSPSSLSSVSTEHESNDIRPWEPSSIGQASMAGRTLFYVLETPLENHLEQIAMHHKRSGRSVLQNQIQIIIRHCVFHIMPAVALVALIANVIIFGVIDVGQNSGQTHMAVEAIIGRSVYVVFPFACTVAWAIMWILARIFTSSFGIVLFDKLQMSKTDYEDMDNIDEFDVEALPPTKDVSVRAPDVWKRFCWIWGNCDYRTLSRSSNLSETLGNITVICSIDKEGTIAEPFCTPEQIVIPDKDDEVVILDLARQENGTSGWNTIIIDEGWHKYLPSLKPLGLTCYLNTNSHRSNKKRQHLDRLEATHRRQDHMRDHGKIMPAQDTCLCRVGRAIGFEPQDLDQFRRLMEVNVFAPFHPANESLAQKDINFAACFTTSICQADDTDSSEKSDAGSSDNGDTLNLQMFTNGNVDLVLNMCMDYFDGTSIRPLDDHTAAVYYGLYLNAIQQDLQCIAFSYRPLSVNNRSNGDSQLIWDRSNLLSPKREQQHQQNNDNAGGSKPYEVFLDLWPQKPPRRSHNLPRLDLVPETQDNDDNGNNFISQPKPFSPLNRPLEIIVEESEEEIEEEEEEHARAQKRETSENSPSSTAATYEHGSKSVCVDSTANKTENSYSYSSKDYTFPLEEVISTPEPSDNRNASEEAIDSTGEMVGGIGERQGEVELDNNSSISSIKTSEPDILSVLPEFLDEKNRTSTLLTKAAPATKATESEIDEPAKQHKNSSTLLDDYTEYDYDHTTLCNFDDESEFLRDAVSEQVFLGLMTLTNDPKTDVCDFIEDLSIAGIRFVYFSQSNGRQSKSFAESLGLETDWNTCILLSSEADNEERNGVGGGGYIEDHDIKARLPRGIENIRSHLLNVDDIPLQISLFAECTPDATREMINIFQENGDVACCIGSALRDSNTLTFAAADLAVGVEPIPHFNRLPFTTGTSSSGRHHAAMRSAVLAGHDVANDGSISTSGALVTQYALGAALTCIPCPLFLQHDTSLYTLMQVIREARRFVAAIQQCGILMAASCLALVLINLVSILCLLPPAVDGYQMLWVLWIVTPLIGFSLFFAPHDENIMSTMSLKNYGHIADICRFSVYAIVRMLPVVVITIFVYTISLAYLLPAQPMFRALSSTFGRSDWMTLDHRNQWALRTAQTYAMISFIYHFICVSATMMYRTRTIVEFPPVRNIPWVLASFSALGLSFVFSSLLIAFGDVNINRVPWYVYFIAFVGPLVMLPLQEVCKLHDKKKWTRFQKLTKLEFNTKLGLHSPL